MKQRVLLYQGRTIIEYIKIQLTQLLAVRQRSSFLFLQNSVDATGSCCGLQRPALSRPSAWVCCGASSSSSICDSLPHWRIRRCLSNSHPILQRMMANAACRRSRWVRDYCPGRQMCWVAGAQTAKTVAEMSTACSGLGWPLRAGAG